MPGAGGGNQTVRDNMAKKKAKQKFEISMTNDLLEKKDIYTDEFGNSKTVIEKAIITEDDDDLSILDKLAGFFIGEASAAEPAVEKQTPVPEGVYESEYFDNVKEPFVGRSAPTFMPPGVDDTGLSFGYDIRTPIVPDMSNIEEITGTGDPDFDYSTLYDADWADVPGWIRDPSRGVFPDTPEGDLSRTILGSEYSQQQIEDAVRALVDTNQIKDYIINKEGKLIPNPDLKDTDTKLTNESLIDEIERQQRLVGIIEESIIEDAISEGLPITKQPPPKKVDVEEAARTIAKESPNDLTKLNNFALWADGVSDAEALREAEAILDEIESRPTVTDRLKKAMGVALGAMLFGDDFVTAMNTGLDVVADDYTAEAKAAKEASDAQAALQKKMGEEARALQISNIESTRDFKESAALKNMELNAKLIKENKAAEIARKNKNTEQAEKIMTSVMDSMKDHANYANVATSDPTAEMNGFLRVLDGQLKAIGKQLDLTDWAQREAMSSVLKKWMQERLAFGKGAAPMSAYAQEMFVKTEAQRFIGIDPNLIAPSRDYLLSEDLMIGTEKDGPGKREQLHVNEQLLDQDHFGTREGTEATIELGQIIKVIAEAGLGEENTLTLLYKDFLDYRQRSIEDKKHSGEIFKDMETIAYNKGWGPFTHFVNVVLKGLGSAAFDENLGMNYDPVLQAESLEISNAALAEYLKSDTYDLEGIKERLKK